MKIKICGIKRIEDVEVLNEYKPDYVGFVFAKSKRQIDGDKAFFLRNNLDKSIKSVGVFVNHKMDEIEEFVADGTIDCVQFHGDESEDDIQYIKQKHPHIQVFKAITVNSHLDILKWENSSADFLLLDNGKGGTGKKFNWEVLQEIGNLKKEIFIAGGLTPENVKDVLKLKPFGVDVSGGVETDNVKDKEKIKKFIKEVREDYE